MKSILIISPDPQTNKMLSLAFELDGWEVSAATSADITSTTKSDIILYDAVEGIRGMKKDDFSKLQTKAKIMIIPPRGMDEEDIKKKLPNVDFVSRRPFELMHLIRTATEIVSS
jgi:DNA-binding response OmpR family regulator